MRSFFATYGRNLGLAFFVCVGAWALILIILPQVTMLQSALTAPKRQLDSSIAATLGRDADLCVSVLKTFDTPANQSSGGMGIPSASRMAVPSAGGMAVPSLGGKKEERPYILQCDRASTHQRMVRDEVEEYLDTLYDLPALAVIATDPIETQIKTAELIRGLAFDLEKRLKEIEKNAWPLTLDNFGALTAARYIPMTPEARIEEDTKLSSKLFSLLGLRIEKSGEIYARIGLMTLVRTLSFAILTTALAVVLCYPVAYKVALATQPQRVVWLMLTLIIPYAIVELMRVYAWTTIIDNRGLINGFLDVIGLIDLDAGEAIQFKRSPLTIFVVIVYAYVLFMVFPMLNVMSTLDKNQIEAARDLGASTFRIHRRIIIPHSKPGIAVGCIATFMLAAGAFSVPRIISRGLQAEWFSQTIYNKFFESENSNIGAAYSFAFTVVCFVLVALFMWAMRARLKDFAKVQS
jgi:spermidine/putrescine transport system permease protein